MDSWLETPDKVTRAGMNCFDLVGMPQDDSSNLEYLNVIRCCSGDFEIYRRIFHFLTKGT